MLPAQAEYELSDDGIELDTEDNGNTPDTDAPEVEDNGNTPDAPDTPADDAQESDSKPATGSIPKARFNEVIAQRETLKEQLADRDRQLEELRQQAAAPAQPDQGAAEVPASIKDLRKQYHEQLMEGNTDGAEEISNQIDELILQQAEVRVSQRQSAQQANDALQDEVKASVEAYPFLNTPEGKDAVELIVLMRDRKAVAGMPLAQALREAVATIAPRFAPDGPNSGASSTTSTKVADNRTVNANARGAADSNRQPPSIQAGIGNRAGGAHIDIAGMSEAQFADLTEDQKRRLRGDA